MFECTKDTPWAEGLPTPVRHHNTHEVGEQENGYPGGDIVKIRCDNCGATWRTELPQ